VSVLKVVGHTAVIFAFLMLGFRTVGRRSLAQLNVVDFLVILLIGSAIETAMVAGDTSLAAGLVCASTLLVLNRVLNDLLRRSPRLRHLVVGLPILLVNNGQLVPGHLQRAGITADDLAEALRQRDEPDASQLRQVILEPDGTIHVVPR
jgi:uncharacterized membrane protein YcaP (DUF421 family)